MLFTQVLIFLSLFFLPRREAWRHSAAVQRGTCLLHFSQNTEIRSLLLPVIYCKVIVSLVPLSVSDSICVERLTSSRAFRQSDIQTKRF